jgi:hypothetical protein
MPEGDPNRPPLPVGAAAPGRLRGSAFADGREPSEIVWPHPPVAVPRLRWAVEPERDDA